jgi:hypothetical protein
MAGTDSGTLTDVAPSLDEKLSVLQRAMTSVVILVLSESLSWGTPAMPRMLPVCLAVARSFIN